MPLPYGRLSAFYFAYFGLLGAWLPYWGLYLQELGHSAVAIGALSSAVMATKVIAPSIWGWLADRTGRRSTIIRLGSFLALLIFFGVFFRSDFWWLMAIVIGYSFFWNAVLAQFEVVTLSHLEGQYHRYSLIRVWGSVGFIVTVAGVGAFLDVFSIHLLPWIYVALLAGIWFSSLTVSEKPGNDQEDQREHSLWRIVSSPVVLAFLLICALLQVSHGPYYTFFSIHLEALGYSKTITGMLWSLGVLAEVVLFLVMHRMMAGFSLRNILLVSLLLSVIRWALIGYYADNAAILFFAQLLHAATFGSSHAVAVELVRRFFKGYQGQGMALYSGVSFGGGGAIGAILSGVLWDYGAEITFLMAVAASLIAFVLAWVFLQDRQLAV
ncbi:PPP family 3-phenylpropionic acid transporter [Litorivivens lipolytica]|uniref:PPP family 3-phenylpropionic acid transporter n=1 Tax=Litorivivens lipolytica TaxID=1524264 RepID=A0A7W4W293_9GAMM|nr:MFS transporter [Litorivivens lipolytica]MBB3046136.1 PPP family 3-phenylpropionic acid transporter [Litorivivens lipolytica]